MRLHSTNQAIALCVCVWCSAFQASFAHESLVAAPWGKGCNDGLLSSMFALAKAPRFELARAKQSRIDEVIAEVKGGYGGTLVLSPRDDVLDSVEFLAEYLRAFSQPGEQLSTYDYRFERILERLAKWPEILNDRRLDWDVWRAYLIYESHCEGTDQYKSGDSIHSLDSAADLLWVFLSVNGKDILADEARRTWWIEQITHGLRSPGGRPLRRWFLLRLVSFTDADTPQLIESRQGDDNDPNQANRDDSRLSWSITEPDAYYPFLIVGGGFIEPVENGPPFREAIEKLADSQGLGYEVWDINDRDVPPTRIWNVDLAPRLSQVALASVIDQESWSKERQDFAVSFFRPFGARSAARHVHLPAKDSHDGVFFFTFRAKLHVWPKAKMDDGVIQMLRLSGLLNERAYQRYLEQRFTALKPTMNGGSPTNQ